MDEAHLSIDAPAEAVYDLVADITNMGRWSPETYKTAWVSDATEPVPGARFKGWNRASVLGFPMRWTTTSVIRQADRGRAFGFDVPFSGTRWTYRFEPSADGASCTVSETRELVNGPIATRVMTAALGSIRTPQIVKGIEVTLERLKAAAETDAAPDPAR